MSKEYQKKGYKPLPHAFKAGNTFGALSSKKGVPQKKTLIKETLANFDNDFKDFMRGEGFIRFLEELEKLKGIAYVQSYLALMEYTFPKLSRMEVIQETERTVINIFGKQQAAPSPHELAQEVLDIDNSITNGELSELDL